jgi:GAF domain-containing protein
VLGVAILSTSSDYRHFTSDEIELVWGIANSVALAVDNARLYEETRQRLAESEGLQRVAAALLHQVSLEEVLEIVCTEAQQLTGATGSAVLLLEDEWLRVAHRTGTVSASFDRVPVEGSFAGIAVRRDEPFLTNDPAGEAYEYWGMNAPRHSWPCLCTRMEMSSACWKWSASRGALRRTMRGSSVSLPIRPPSTSSTPG